MVVFFFQGTSFYNRPVHIQSEYFFHFSVFFRNQDRSLLITPLYRMADISIIKITHFKDYCFMRWQLLSHLEFLPVCICSRCKARNSVFFNSFLRGITKPCTVFFTISNYGIQQFIFSDNSNDFLRL